MSADCITYHIDKDDRIVFLSESWKSFASNNMAGVLTKDYVLNKSIYDFVADEKIRHLYQMVLDRSRHEQKRIRLPFRCDSPDRRRYMAMEVFPLNADLLSMKSCMLKEELREPVSLLDTTIPRTDDYLTICSWCKRVRVSEDNWADVELAIEQLSLFDDSGLPKLSHGMCNDCYKNAIAEVNQQK